MGELYNTPPIMQGGKYRFAWNPPTLSKNTHMQKEFYLQHIKKTYAEMPK